MIFVYLCVFDGVIYWVNVIWKMVMFVLVVRFVFGLLIFCLCSVVVRVVDSFVSLINLCLCRFGWVVMIFLCRCVNGWCLLLKNLFVFSKVVVIVLSGVVFDGVL